MIDTLGSDHAPHLLSEKERPYLKCPSGIPSIQQSLSVAITAAKAFNEGKDEGEDTLLTLSRIATAFSERPAEIMGIRDRGFLKVGYFADLVVVDVDREYSVQDVAYKCGWSPYDAVTLTAPVEMVFLNGSPVVSSSRLIALTPSGHALEFSPADR